MKQNQAIGKLSEVARAPFAVATALLVAASMFAQTPTTPTKPATTPPAKPAPAKPAPAKPAVVAAPAKPAAPATPAAKPVTPVAAKTAVVPAMSANQVVQPAASRAVIAPTTTTGTGAAATAAGMSSAAGAVSTVGGASSAGAVSSLAGNGQRGAVTIPGVGSFLWGDWTAVVYGCYRTAGSNRVLCDFDTSKQNGTQANAAQMWSGLNVVEGSGRVSMRHNAFFMGDDGSQFPTGYISPTPVRLLMEYDDVSASATSVTMVLANQRVQSVPITAVDPNAPPGSIPARGAGNAQQAAGTPAAAGSSNPLDKAQQGMNAATNQINNANDQKKKAKSIWDQMKGAMQSTKQ